MAKPFSQWIDEDAPANAAGGGGVAGIGIGPKGEPGVKLPRKRYDMASEDADDDVIAETTYVYVCKKCKHIYGPAGEVKKVCPKCKSTDADTRDESELLDEGVVAPMPPHSDAQDVPELGTNQPNLSTHYDSVMSGLKTELGRTRYKLAIKPNSRTLKAAEESLLRKITRHNNKIAKHLGESANASQEAYDKIIAHLNSGGAIQIHTHLKTYGPYWKKHADMFKPSTRPEDTGVYVQHHSKWLYARPETVKFYRKAVSEAVEPDDAFAGADVFNVKTETFMKSRFGKSRYHRYSKYVGEEERAEDIRQHGRGTKRDIVLKDSATGAMVYLRRKQQTG